MSIFPYVYYMVSSFHVTDNEKTIALYAGMVTSAFAFAEFSTSIVWGKLSDKFGRKPILLSGLAGTGLSMVLFGFAPNLATALIARALGGLLNGQVHVSTWSMCRCIDFDTRNIGVLNTTVAEVVTVEKHQCMPTFDSSTALGVQLTYMSSSSFQYHAWRLVYWVC